MSFDYWKVYFDVDVDMLKQRYIKFINPKDDSLAGDIKVKPELYGPFWLSTSLIIFLFTFGNIADI